MANVKQHEGDGSVPGIYEGEGHPGACKYPPETIKHEVSMASGKAKMNWTHPPLGPEQHYIDSEEGGKKMAAAEGEGHGGPSKHTTHSGHKPKHRSTSGVPGHTLTGN